MPSRIPSHAQKRKQSPSSKDSSPKSRQPKTQARTTKPSLPALPKKTLTALPSPRAVI